MCFATGPIEQARIGVMANQIATEPRAKAALQQRPHDHGIFWKALWQKERQRLEKAQGRPSQKKSPLNLHGEVCRSESNQLL